ncbi:MAG: DUF3037 domain-containing protein [Gammaproteobacteria bacterium]|nr:DUF3037 domain-containing protein [Gammaproteobacteria bacterium]
MNTACHYAIVRFLPFVETGEFANVGVAIFAPDARYFGFKLLTNRHARVTNFFEQLDAKVFRVAMRTFRDELTRIDYAFKPLGTDRRLKALDRPGTMTLWTEVIKPRETIIRFGEPRVVIARDPAQKLAELFDYYVERNFVTHEYQEQALERGLRGWLKAARLDQRFLPDTIGNDEYHARFPFVEKEDDRPVKVIKPLNLGYPDAAKIIDHGGQWIVRVNALKKRNLLPRDALFAVDGPADMTTPRGRARVEVVRELEDTGVTVVPFQDKQRVIEFARG